MNKITINGIEIEFDSGVEIQVEGAKVTIKTRAAVPSYPLVPVFWPIQYQRPVTLPSFTTPCLPQYPYTITCSGEASADCVSISPTQ